MSKAFKKFMILWTGELISSVGSGLTAFALGIYAYQISGTASSIALVTLCAFLPMMLFSPLGGICADKFDRRLMMILGDFLSVFGLFYILLCIKSGNIELWQICLGVSISSIFTALIDPSFKATITDLLSEEEYAKASGMIQIAGSARFLLSPLIAGIILEKANIELILIIDICTFFFTVFAAIFVKKRIKQNKTTDKNLIDSLKEAITIIKNKKGITALIILTALVCLFVGFFQVLATPMLLPIMSVKSLGILESVAGIGMLVSSVLIGILGNKTTYQKMLSYSLIFCGISVLLFGSYTSTIFLGITAFLFFASLPFANTSLEVLIRKNIPNEVQGRVWSLIALVTQLGYVISYICAGVLADYIFNPLLVENGILSSSIGKIIGVGEGRGIGLLFIITGIIIVVLALTILKNKNIKTLEKA